MDARLRNPSGRIVRRPRAGRRAKEDGHRRGRRSYSEAPTTIVVDNSTPGLYWSWSMSSLGSILESSWSLRNDKGTAYWPRPEQPGLPFVSDPPAFIVEDTLQRTCQSTGHGIPMDARSLRARPNGLSGIQVLTCCPQAPKDGNCPETVHQSPKSPSLSCAVSALTSRQICW